MLNNHRPPIVRETDENGDDIVRVPLDPNGSCWAIVDADDFDSLPPELTRTWFLNDNGEGRGYEYVRAYAAGATGRLVTVARVILGVGRGEAVRSISGDRCDLRRRNLWIGRDARAKRDDRQQVASRRAASVAAA